MHELNYDSFTLRKETCILTVSWIKINSPNTYDAWKKSSIVNYSQTNSSSKKKVTLCNDYRDSFSVSWNASETVVETIAWWETNDLRRQKWLLWIWTGNKCARIQTRFLISSKKNLEKGAYSLWKNLRWMRV